MTAKQNQDVSAPTSKTESAKDDKLLRQSQQGAALIITQEPKLSQLSPVSQDVMHAKIVVASQPLKIDIDTPTDWPAVLLPFVLGAAAFYFTTTNQKQQIRSSTASYRNEWLKDVREAAIEFSSVASEFQLRVMADPNFELAHPDEARAMLTRMIKAQSTLVLMLDVNQDYKKPIVKLMDFVVLNIGQSGAPMIEAGKAILEFGKQTHLVLEKAWQDIRRDLGHQKDLFTRLKNLIHGKAP